MKNKVIKHKKTNAWYRTPLGRALLKSELNGLSKILPKFFGYYIAQISGIDKSGAILADSKINNRIIINPSNELKNEEAGIKCDLDALPFVPKSIDVIVLFHVLEQAKDPLKLLAEVHSALIDGGYLVIVGFNPKSIWGATKFFKNLKHTIWNGRWFTPKKLSQILLHIGFGIGEYQTLYFRPPFKDPAKMAFLEGIGGMLWPNCGASYIYVAQKTSPVLTPIKKLKSILKLPKLTKRLVKPTSRSA